MHVRELNPYFKRHKWQRRAFALLLLTTFPVTVVIMRQVYLNYCGPISWKGSFKQGWEEATACVGKMEGERWF